MSRIAIVGGHGQIARHLIPLLAEQGHSPLALIRNPAQAPGLEDLGATVGLLDIENSTESDFSDAFAGCDAVVFAAGGGPDGDIDRKRTVDFEGSLKSIAGAKAAGISRFVQISAIAVDTPVRPGAGEVWTAYVEAKRDADAALRASELDWTIIRPGGLVDERATGLVTIGEEVARAEIPRADVAAVISTVLADDRTVGRQWEVTSGAQAIPEAIDAAVQD